MNTWISGAAVGCAEAAALLFLLRITSGRSNTAFPVPFRIASGVITGIYGISVLISVILCGYILEVSEAAYLTIQLIILVGFVVVCVLLELGGRYAGSQERKQFDERNVQKKLANRISSIRSQIQTMSDIPEPSGLLQEFRKLEETILYSDPAVSAAWREIKSLLEQHISLLEDQVKLMNAVAVPKKAEAAAETTQIVRKIHEIMDEQKKQSLLLNSKSI